MPHRRANRRAVSARSLTKEAGRVVNDVADSAAWSKTVRLAHRDRVAATCSTGFTCDAADADITRTRLAYRTGGTAPTFTTGAAVRALLIVLALYARVGYGQMVVLASFRTARIEGAPVVVSAIGMAGAKAGTGGQIGAEHTGALRFNLRRTLGALQIGLFRATLVQFLLTLSQVLGGLLRFLFRRGLC